MTRFPLQELSVSTTAAIVNHGTVSVCLYERPTCVTLTPNKLPQPLCQTLYELLRRLQQRTWH